MEDVVDDDVVLEDVVVDRRASVDVDRRAVVDVDVDELVVVDSGPRLVVVDSAVWPALPPPDEDEAHPVAANMAARAATVNACVRRRR